MKRKLKLQEFIENNVDWKIILQDAPYYLKIKEDEKYILFKYNQISSDFSNEIVQEARGVIFDKETLKPVAIPFFKFFNYGEITAADVDMKSALIQEKVDGSLVKLWYHDGRWHWSTNGTIDAYKTEASTLSGLTSNKTFGDLIDEALPKAFYNYIVELDTESTHMFELIGPENKIVLDYDETELVYLGSRRNKTLKEFQSPVAYKAFRTPKRYKWGAASLQEIKEIVNTLDGEEGVVVVDAAYNRVKIKNPEYLLLSKLHNSISDKFLLQVILDNETEEFRATVLDKEILKRLNELEAYIIMLTNSIDTYVTTMIEYGMSKKDFAIGNKESKFFALMMIAWSDSDKSCREKFLQLPVSKVLYLLKEFKELQEYMRK